MKTKIAIILLASCAISFLSAQQPQAEDAAAKIQLLKKFDKDGDGVLNKEEREAAEALAKQIKGITITVLAKFGGEKMYGSVTNQDVSDALKAMGYDVDKKKIVIKDAIKSVGIYDAEVKVYRDVNAKIKIKVDRA